MIFLRSALFNLCFYGVTLVCSLLGALAALISLPLLKRLEGAWGRTNLALLRLICGIRYEVSGRENLPPGAAIIASQHQSAFDTFVWMALVPQVAYVLKQELTRIPVFGQLLTPLGHIPVDRKAGASALRRMLADSTRRLEDGAQVVIFPEGTRVAAGGRGQAQPGVVALATHGGAPLIPVATDSGFCWGRNAFVKRPGTIHIVIMPALPPGLRRGPLMEALQQSWDEGQEKIARICG